MRGRLGTRQARHSLHGNRIAQQERKDGDNILMRRIIGSEPQIKPGSPARPVNTTTHFLDGAADAPKLRDGEVAHEVLHHDAPQAPRVQPAQGQFVPRLLQLRAQRRILSAELLHRSSAAPATRRRKTKEEEDDDDDDEWAAPLHARTPAGHASLVGLCQLTGRHVGD